MVPGEANLTAATNAYDQRTITLPGFTSASGVTAKVDFRDAQDEGGALYLSLTNGSGLTVTSDGSNLLIAWQITETQMDTLKAAVHAAGAGLCYWSLKVTLNTGVTQQWIYGTFTPFATATG